MFMPAFTILFFKFSFYLNFVHIKMTEKIGALILKLNEQFVAGTNGDNLLITVQLLQQELIQQQQAVDKLKSSISVFIPGQTKVAVIDVTQQAPAPKPVEKLLFELDEQPEEPVQIPVHAKYQPAPATSTPPLPPLHSFPTYTRQATPEAKPAAAATKEINEIIPGPNKPSLNEIFPPNAVPELASKLSGQEKILDLRKAININDRFQYINHLFKGDETMYERSIITINGFTNMAEASLWISRELSFKLSWKNDDELVQQFNQLISRRFA
jgi:hypothetical protein